MGKRNSFTARVLALLLGMILGGLPTYAATADGGYAGHRVVAGDYNGDGWLDMILQALPGFHGNAEFVADQEGEFGQPTQTWPDRHLNLDWRANAHKIAVGDFNGDGRDDLFLQANTGFASAVLLANANGQFRRVAATPPATLDGLDLTTAAHGLVVGDFNGDGRDDLLLQASAFTASEGIALARPDGTFRGLASHWDDGLLGLAWSTDHAMLTAGDFNGDGRAELLLRSTDVGAPGAVCCSLVRFDAAAKPAAKLQSWAVDYLGINWQPSAAHAVAGDFNGDGRDDLFIQPVAPGGNVYVLLAEKNGRFTAIADQWPSERDGVDWSAESYLLVPGKDGSLLMIPKQTGLPYRRASFSSAGRLTGVTTLQGPPADALAAVSGGDSGAGSGIPLAPRISPHTGGDGVVGTTNGSFSVDPRGGAAYSIPITVAPGVNGLAPDLALAYNSRSGDNQLGLGWSLSGLSAISRCPKTFASNGAARPVMIDTSDDFCLDGMHLYLKSGGYGDDGAEYYTKPATFQQVISHTSDNDLGPQSFTVKDKAGLIREYGATADSAIGAGNNFDGRTVAWLLDEITDRHDNFIKFHYVKTQGQGNADVDYYLSEVDYGNNAGATVGSISFDYDKRSVNSSVPFFSAGLEHLISELLTKITVSSAGSTIRTYTLGYDQQTGFSPELTSVKECGDDGSCFRPTSFSYAPIQRGFTGSWSTYVNPNGAGNIHAGDVDGDGRTDLIFTNGSSHWCVVLATTKNMDCTSIGQGEAPQDALVADINSDGFSDMLVPVQQGGVHKWRLLLSNGTTFTATGTYINNYDSLTNHPTIADLNGDGYPDLILKKNGFLYYYLNNAADPGNFGTGVTTGFHVVGEQHLIPIRFRGGMQQAVFVTANGCDSGQSCQNSLGALHYDDSSHQLELSYRATGEADSILFLDINGDGLDDMMVYGTSAATFCGQDTWCLYLNRGGSFSHEDWHSNNFASTEHPGSSIVMDYTGDGRDDLLVPANGHGWAALYADWYSGSVIQLDKTDTGIQHDVVSHPAFAINYDGKGVGDLLQNRNNTWQVRAHAGSAWPTTAHGGELTSITNGLGEVTSISYGSVAASPTYAAAHRFYSPDPNEGVGNGSGAGAVREFDGPLYVVTGISTTVSFGYTLATNYYWYGARLDRSGRGFLGFAKQKATSNGDRETRAVYRLEFPYTGMITSLTKSVNGNTLTDIENTDITTKSTDYGPFPYVGTSTEKDYKLSGGSYKTVTTTDQYDGFGNDTLHKVITGGGGETSTVTTTNQYHNTVSDWCLGRLYDPKVVYSGIGQSRTRHSTFTYDGTHCDLATESFEPAGGDVAALAWKKTLTRDGFGNVHKETLQPINGNTNFTVRTTTTDYDTQGRYPKDQLDALGHKTTYGWDQAEGVKTAETDPNGVTVTYTYDGFGRSTGGTGPYGNEGTTLERQWCGVADCQDTAHSVYAVIATQTAGGETVTEYDDAGNKTTESSIGFGGQWSNTAYGYDDLGRNYLVSAPYLTNDTPCWTFTQFDALNRPLHVYTPTNQNQCGPVDPPLPDDPPTNEIETNYAYNGFTTTATTGSGTTQHQTQTTVNVLGKPETVKRMLKGPHTGNPGLVTVQSLAYDAAGDETAVTDAAGETVTLTYDAAGKYRTGRTSPTSGAWTYSYDALGELTGQSDASGNVTTQHYNTLGQMTQRAVTDGNGNTTTTTWTYGSSAANHNVEKLTKVVQSDGWQETYAYNGQGDVNETTTTIDGTAYQVNTGYDSYGRVTSVTYPASPQPPDVAPVAVAVASPTNVTSARTVTLDGTGSHDPDGGPEPLSYQWTVQDKPQGEGAVTITNANSATAHVAFDADDVNGDYVFKLTVGDGDATDTDTATVTVNIPPAKPKGLSVSPPTSHTGLYTVSWDSVENADAYKLRESADDGTHWTQVYSGGATSWQPSHAKDDGTYNYEVRACDPCSPWSAEATEHVVIIPPAPASLTANPNPVYSGGLYYMSWPAVHPTPSYYLLQSYDDLTDSWHQKYQGSDTHSQNFEAPSTSPNVSKWIQYRVKACSANGCSGWTNGVEHVQCAPDIRTCNPPAPVKGKDIGPHSGTARLALHYEYDSAGEVVQAYTTDITHPFWTATGADAAGHVTMAAAGNRGAITLTRVYDRATGALRQAQADGVNGLFQDSSYGYDQYGNLTSRADDLPARGESESYSYDSFDRLAVATADIPNVGNDITTASATYTVSGDLESRTDAAGSFGYTYGVGNQPHRLTQVSGALDVALGYDAAGRVTGSAALAIVYGGRGLARTITRHGHQSALRYDANGHEYQETRDGKQTITLIAGGAFRVIADSVSGVTGYRQALVVNGAVIGQVVNSSANGTRHYEFFATDNLGSVTEITDAAGNELAGYCYDPFGRRREAVNWKTIVPIAQLRNFKPPTRRGYTGGEMLDETGMVLLGARVYAPELGRWLSPDPAGAGSPYVYVSNNPESDTDPTGTISGLQIAEIAALVAITVATGGAALPVIVAIGAAEGFATGFIASGGNFRAGLIGAAGGAAFAAIGGAPIGNVFTKAAIDGFAGGALTEANGGRFSDGFLGAFVAGAAGGEIDSRIMPNNESAGAIAARTAAAAALGGSVSRISGGSFANGAWSAAFAQMFGDIARKAEDPQATEAQKETLEKTGYSEFQGPASDLETTRFMDDNGNFIGRKSQEFCIEDKCVIPSSAIPAGATMIVHTHVALSVDATSFDVQVYKLSRDIPGYQDWAPLEAHMTNGVLTPGGEKYVIEGLVSGHNVITARAVYLGGGDSRFGLYVQNHWQYGLTNKDIIGMARNYLLHR